MSISLYYVPYLQHFFYNDSFIDTMLLTSDESDNLHGQKPKAIDDTNTLQVGEMDKDFCI